MMTTSGRFIVVEGLEGAGKSTAITFIENFLKELNIDFVTCREPGGTETGERLRELIKQKNSDTAPVPLCELLMFYAARVQLLEKVIYPALKKGQWVIADRFELSTFAYQGGGRGIDHRVLETLSAICLKGFQPDLVLFLDIDPQEGLKRALSRGAYDRFEEESLDFFIKVHNAYYQKIETMDNVVVIRAEEALEAVQNDIVQALKGYMEMPDHG